MREIFDRPPDRDEPPILSVAEITATIRDLFEQSFPVVRVQGEVSNLSRPQSGHLYFSLLEEQGPRAAGARLGSAQLACVVWRSDAARLRVRPQNGMRIVVTGRLGVYAARGTYQLIAQRLQPVGVGELQRLFEELKERLRGEGLFDAERKRPLPFRPRCIGLVTSPRGAAIQDFLRLVYRRNPLAWVRVIPVRVQGDGAANEIAAALRLLEKERDVEVIVLTRGGGSLEDLWAFNEEKVARAIAACRVPTIAAVGHEVDFSIADFVADARAQTPTHASELVVPDTALLRERLEAVRSRLARGAETMIQSALERCSGLSRRRLFQEPQALIQERFERCDQSSGELKNRLYNRARQWDDGLNALAGRLAALSPLNVLERGYAVVTDESGRVLHEARQVRKDQRLQIRLARGSIVARAEDGEVVEGAG